LLLYKGVDSKDTAHFTSDCPSTIDNKYLKLVLSHRKKENKNVTIYWTENKLLIILSP
jgi:hypothetical protein